MKNEQIDILLGADKNVENQTKLHFFSVFPGRRVDL